MIFTLLNNVLLKNKEKVKKLETFDLSFFIGKSYFTEDGSQNYLIFQSIYKLQKVNW